MKLLRLHIFGEQPSIWISKQNRAVWNEAKTLAFVFSIRKSYPYMWYINVKVEYVIVIVFIHTQLYYKTRRAKVVCNTLSSLVQILSTKLIAVQQRYEAAAISIRKGLFKCTLALFDHKDLLKLKKKKKIGVFKKSGFSKNRGF